MNHGRTLGALAAAFLGTAAQAQMLMAPDVLTDRVLLFSGWDGHLVDANFINNAQTGATMNYVQEVLVVGNEIWASESISDRIYRFTLDGQHLNSTIIGGTFQNPIDGPHGMAFLNGIVFTACSSTAKHGGADWVARVSPSSGRATSTFSTTPNSLSDLVTDGANLLATNYDESAVDLYSPSGVRLQRIITGEFGTGMTFPQQVLRRANGNILVASGKGLYEYTGTGQLLDAWLNDTFTNVRGVAELRNGNYIVSSASGVKVINPATDEISLVHASGNVGYLNVLPQERPTESGQTQGRDPNSVASRPR